MSIDFVYFSNYSGNTKRFIEKLDDGNINIYRIPIASSDGLNYPDSGNGYILFVPTYGGGSERSAIPRQVRKFLNVPTNRERLKGVVGLGNTNFGDNYCKAADLIAQKTGVPVLARVEIFGTDDDVTRVNERLRLFNDNKQWV